MKGKRKRASWARKNEAKSIERSRKNKKIRGDLKQNNK